MSFFLVSTISYLVKLPSLTNKKIIWIDQINPNYAWFYDPIVDQLIAKEYTIISFGNKYRKVDNFLEFIQPLITIPLVIISVDAHRFIKKNSIKLFKCFMQ